MKLQSKFLRNLTNALSWKTKRRIIVFESDDWGSINMKNQKTYKLLFEKGIPVNTSNYSRLDCLENRKDLDDLFNLLKNHKNEQGNNPKFTFNTVLSNPNFIEIKNHNYNCFIKENFYDSYKKYYCENNIDIWKSAIKEKIITPQFHAREHLNRFLWINDLKNRNLKTLIGFENNFFGKGLTTSSSSRSHYLATYHATTNHEQELMDLNLQKGLSEFSELFGFLSKTFIASNYTWSSKIHKTLSDNKVIGIQGQRVQLDPNFKLNKLKKIRHYTGEKNNFNQIYTVRNSVFEPYSDFKSDWVEKTMRDIDNAFFWKTPSIIVTHRVNYVSTMSMKNKERNLNLLDLLLKKIIKKYPNVEFLSSDELADEINKNR